MIKNPDVTVRMRGVMEKCTFCLQRIEQAQDRPEGQGGRLGRRGGAGGHVHDGVRAGLPGGGDCVRQPERPEQPRLQAQDAVSGITRVLDFLVTKPRTTYLARVRNPNPAMPDYQRSAAELSGIRAEDGQPVETLKVTVRMPQHAAHLRAEKGAH